MLKGYAMSFLFGDVGILVFVQWVGLVGSRFRRTFVMHFGPGVPSSKILSKAV